MSIENEKTVESYSSSVDEYINGTPQEVSGVAKEWIDSSLNGLPKESRILELGSASGRDAQYIQSHGYEVECSDVVPEFVNALAANGFKARLIDALKDELPNDLDLVLAQAVLMHFTRDETRKIIKKVYDSLNDNGRFAFTLKQGEGEGWSSKKVGQPRYFTYWSGDEIRGILNDVGFSAAHILENRKTRNSTWVQVIAQK